MQSELFAEANRESAAPGQRWVRQSSKMLRVDTRGLDVIAAKGAMVAYQGEIQFEHESSGSMTKFLKQAVTGEGAPLMRMSGQGEVFLARDAQDIFTVELAEEGLTVNGDSLLAFDHTLDWDITMMRGAGMMAGGLFNLQISGRGTVAVSCDGQPLVLDCSQQPTYVDPQAAVCWSSNLTPSIVSTTTFRSMLRGGTGEAFQLAFHGPGFVVVQPSEGRPKPAQAASGSGNSGSSDGRQGLLGGLFN
ncbi:AIM24 family protein [Plantibacter sp. VKM Ac-2880]|uniref:AIM24 family protein n=1 Tax=Plantibacter sp. VKM Ac-2880 TaxID=2783827 RepID=UPI00188F3698|nr:AIM24 family protein [Plantibacter sp. VKM Ac-2880]MBF4570076.1 AIM24 family protein [Plantibacter sp. VKM Ac-2880]